MSNVSPPVLFTFTMPHSSNDPIELAFDATSAAELDALFRLHYGRLVRALTVVSGDRELAADAVQEAFVKAHLRWRRLRHYEDPVGWIRRVAINGMRDGHRRTRRKQDAMDRLRSDAVHQSAANPDTTHDELSHRSGDTDGVMTMLRLLPRQQRICIALFHVDGLPIAEIAATLGISDGAVKFHLHQGRERLRGTINGPAAPGRHQGNDE